MCPAADPKNSGQPGCTPAERERHSQLLACGGGLIDAYRHLHPTPNKEAEEGAGGVGGAAAGAGTGAGAGVGVGAGTETEGITWRGTAGTEVAAMGRFYGK
ncbi:unnamed protein product, partial [Laminaria digitata]